MKNCTCLIFLFFAFLWSQRAQSQTGTKDSTTEKKRSYWQADIDYLSNAVYLGRKDSARLPYLTPSIGYYHASGLYADGGLSYLAAAGDNRIDLYYLDAGYIFSHHNFQAQLSATKYFYNNNSTNVKADLKAGVDLLAAYDFGFVQPSAEAAVNFGQVTDYILTLGLEHGFYWGDDFDITPTAYLNAGTQNAYNTYYNQRKFAARKKKGRIRNIHYDITASVANAAAFKTLDYEFSLPINYKLRSFTFHLTPGMAIPVNPAVIRYTVKSSAGSQSSTLYREELGSTFYWNAGVSLTF